MDILKVYDTKIASDVSSVGKVVEDIIHCLHNEYLIEEECILFDSKVILNELILNAVKHGNKEDRNRKVKVTAAIINHKYVLFHIEDEGEGYNYRCILNKEISFCDDLDICDMLEGGRGMTIVKCLCDKIKFNKRGNKVSVLKKINIK